MTNEQRDVPPDPAVVWRHHLFNGRDALEDVAQIERLAAAGGRAPRVYRAKTAQSARTLTQLCGPAPR